MCSSLFLARARSISSALSLSPLFDGVSERTQLVVRVVRVCIPYRSVVDRIAVHSGGASPSFRRLSAWRVSASAAARGPAQKRRGSDLLQPKPARGSRRTAVMQPGPASGLRTKDTRYEMKKFTFKGVLDGFRSSVQAAPRGNEQEIQETLRPDHFQIKKVSFANASRAAELEGQRQWGRWRGGGVFTPARTARLACSVLCKLRSVDTRSPPTKTLAFTTASLIFLSRIPLYLSGRIHLISKAIN